MIAQVLFFFFFLVDKWNGQAQLKTMHVEKGFSNSEMDGNPSICDFTMNNGIFFASSI